MRLQWATGMQATSTGFVESFPAAFSLLGHQHPDMAIPTLTFPLDFSVLALTWISDAVTKMYFSAIYILPG